MKMSPKGRQLLTAREGNVLTAYQDGGGVWTIGVGHTAAAGLPKPVKGMKISAIESDAILSRDLGQYERAVDEAVQIVLNQNEFDALVSLCFNIGIGAFRKSTLVKRLNAGNRKAAAEQFLVWNKDNGKTIRGLTTRREGERAQFLSKANLDAAVIAVPVDVPVKPTVVDIEPAPSYIPTVWERAMSWLKSLFS